MINKMKPTITKKIVIKEFAQQMTFDEFQEPFVTVYNMEEPNKIDLTMCNTKCRHKWIYPAKTPQYILFSKANDEWIQKYYRKHSGRRLRSDTAKATKRSQIRRQRPVLLRSRKLNTTKKKNRISKSKSKIRNKKVKPYSKTKKTKSKSKKKTRKYQIIRSNEEIRSSTRSRSRNKSKGKPTKKLNK